MMTLKDSDLVGALCDIPNYKADPGDLGSSELSLTRSILQTGLL